jgi:hypothetical protein
MQFGTCLAATRRTGGDDPILRGASRGGGRGCSRGGDGSCPGGVKTEFALGKGRTPEGVAQSGMLDPEDVASAVLLACTQPAHSRIIEIQMRTMAEPLT